MPSSRHTALSRRPPETAPEGQRAAEGPDNSRTGEDGDSRPHTHTGGAHDVCLMRASPNIAKHVEAPGFPEDGRQDLRPGALPFLAEKRIALASAGSWHQPGRPARGRHEGLP
ncbi:hypothetical protein LA080_012533 [Diaporthe eres]|nr:hypothetical protein LA080_012533 [Diaporthe eres]